MKFTVSVPSWKHHLRHTRSNLTVNALVSAIVQCVCVSIIHANLITQ